MPTPSQYGQYIQDIPLRDEVDCAEIPIKHFQNSVAHAMRLVDYLLDLKKKTPVYAKGFDRHLKAVSALAFFQMVAAFERLLKELAAVCVDEIAPLCTDDRFKEFRIRGEDATSHIHDQTVGRALCESQLWHNTNDVNDRFREVLKSIGNLQAFTLFDKNVAGTLRSEVKTIRVMFQLRHTIAHNLGSLTRTDAGKLQRLLGQHRVGPKELDIDRKHVFYLQQFLSPLAVEINRSVAIRLGQNLTEFHGISPALIDHIDRSKALAKLFNSRFIISGHTELP